MNSVAWRRWLPLAALLWSHSLAAAEPDTHGPPPANAAELFQDALRDYDRGDIETAIAKLRQAQAAAPHPTVLYNLAQFLEAAGQHAEAFRCFEQYLTMLGTEVEPAREQAVRSKLRALRLRLASFRFETSPAQAIVQVDGQNVDPSSEVLLSPGGHRLDVISAGFEPVELELKAVEGEAQRLILQLKPSAPVASPRSAGVGAPPASPPTPRRLDARPSGSTRTWAVVALATGAALAGGAAVLQVVNASRSDDWRARNRQLDEVEPQMRGDAYWAARAQNAELARSIRHVDGVQLGLFIGAGALAATGVGLWLTSPTTAGNGRTAGVTLRRSW